VIVAAAFFVSSIDRIVRRLGGPRILALPFLRALAIVAALAWFLLTPQEFPRRPQIALAVLAFFAYSLLIFLSLWRWPSRTLSLHVPILLVDLSFALLLIHLTGGARSTLFLALLLIAGLQSYYYGMTRGIVVAVGAAAAYLWVIWPTLVGEQWANYAVRMAVLLGTAVGVGILADIEERERAEVARLSREAQGRERFIRGVVESIRDGVMVLDRDGRVVAWNRAMEERYDVRAGDVVGRSFFDVFPNSRREGIATPIERLLAGASEEITLDTVEHETLKKGRVILNIRGSLLRERMAPSGAVLLIEDITDRVALERSTRQAEKLAALGTLGAGLAHELNNPIGIITSRIELMLEEAQRAGDFPEETVEDLQVLHRNAQRVARIAGSLLSFARQSQEDMGPVDLNHIVEETLLLVEKTATKEGIVINRRLSSNLPKMWGDSNALQQVVLNLLTNARDALGGEGEIIITTRLQGEPLSVVLEVSDNGPGIPPEILPKIFDPFYTTKPQGTGLGLSVTYGIVRDHRGTIDVQSRPGRGTTFVLTFPAASQEKSA
jgi:PAS domain S-box-containing protein